jgi:hypothetical protein
MAEVHPLLSPNCAWMLTRREANKQVTAFGRGQQGSLHAGKTSILSMMT